MANQKEAKVFREAGLVAVEGVEIEGFVFKGRSSEGAVFVNEDGEVMVARFIVKAEGTDADELVAEFEKKQAEAARKAKEKAEKVEKAKK